MDWLNKLFNLFEKKDKQRTFLDTAASTPVLKEVGEEMVKYFSREFYNPSGIYREGVQARQGLEGYRARVAKILGAGSKEVIFTSGGTESNNLAILGVVEAFRRAQDEKPEKERDKPHLIISAIEHPSVEEVAKEAVRRGAELSLLPVDSDGFVKVDELEKLITKNTVLVSVSLANSEIGTIQAIPKLGRIVKEARKKHGGVYPLLHSDASAGISYLPVTLEGLQADLITVDAAKMYGPKGSGALIMRRGVKIHPILFGGGQEKGLRSGTENPAMVAGLAKALEIAVRDREVETKRLHSLRQSAIKEIWKRLPEAHINGAQVPGGDVKTNLPDILSVSIPSVLGELLVLKLDSLGVAVSVGTACSTDQKISGSPVLRAMGKSEFAESTVRISLGRQTTEKELNEAIKIFCREAKNMIK
jgi:cysteine desulfurase